ncbi:Alpha-D-GlcNAc alpha-1,2-L-rhamnosyltransferase [Roseibacterium elongatum DSM 19469]|uniref:Alpha-D-GlcNAc alpha-1,2-L-rhamnosyltransferase n=1 Tax=Roseicyclus elongatus DSM 19469 TaxID=1294273 RepID=W8RTW1_9RHOB|nr:DUF1972 domain-containing protein [Roseibacterium elongatum]AHM04643.1 Alpha-D-GlcNAc alpha-1,2-L-rhamnosyltransferase [Roseibacterium elongatum DSM 19469]
MPGRDGPRIAIVGTNGVPARYGGFETLAEQLIRAAALEGVSDRFTVWCPAPRGTPPPPQRWLGARLRSLPLRANGVQSIPYDIASMARECWGKDPATTVLVLGTSGTAALPLFRWTGRSRLIVNIDGREWGRKKWGKAARGFLRRSEAGAVRAAHAVIADNRVIADEIEARYGRAPRIIAYGGDHALRPAPADIADLNLPERYALGIARAEPENSLDLILDAFAPYPDRPLVLVSNWQDTAQGRALKATYRGASHLHLLDAEHDPARLRAIRDRAHLYIHGHTAGGTNPSLVEMMHFGIPVAVFDCAYNLETTEDRAARFRDAEGLARLYPDLCDTPLARQIGTALAEIANRRYRWDEVAAAYFDLLGL